MDHLQGKPPVCWGMALFGHMSMFKSGWYTAWPLFGFSCLPATTRGEALASSALSTPAYREVFWVSQFSEESDRNTPHPILSWCGSVVLGLATGVGLLLLFAVGLLSWPLALLGLLFLHPSWATQPPQIWISKRVINKYASPCHHIEASNWGSLVV